MKPLLNSEERTLETADFLLRNEAWWGKRRTFEIVALADRRHGRGVQA